MGCTGRPVFSDHLLVDFAADEARWCHGDSDGNVGPSVVEELIAGQLAKGLFGWADSPTEGLLLDEEVRSLTLSSSLESSKEIHADCCCLVPTIIGEIGHANSELPGCVITCSCGAAG